MKFKISEIEIKKSETERRCLHDNCTQCSGSGVRKDGLGPCIHMISCPCPRCNPYRM